jgi:predicted alpha/beta hydrolase family esterase
MLLDPPEPTRDSGARIMTIFLLHGSFGHTAENWIPSAAEALRNDGVVVVTPSLPTPAFQSFATWAAVMDAYRTAGVLDQSSTVVAHSSAAPFAVRYIGTSGVELAGLVTVSGFSHFTSGNEAFDEINAAIDVQDTTDFKRTQGQVSSRTSFYADNDPFLPLDVLRHFADALGSEHRLVSGAGHFNADSGYSAFEELVSLLLKVDV